MEIRRPLLPHWLGKHLAHVQLVWIVACLPALIFSEQVPLIWTLGSLLGLALVPCLGWLYRQRPLPRTPLDLSIALLLLLLPLNLWLSINRALTLPHVYKVIAGVALFYGIVGFLQATGWYHWSALGFCMLGLVLVPVVFLGTDWSGPKFSWLPWNPITLFPPLLRPFWKPEGFAGFNSNLVGGILAMLLPVPLAYTLFSRKRWLRLAAGVEVGVIAATLLLTQSRGAMLAVVVAVIVMLGVRNWRWLVALILLAGVGILVLSRVEALAPVARLDIDTDVARALNSLEGRMELWSRAVYMIQDFPLTGIGMGLVADVLPRLYPTFLISPAVRIEHLHNLYLNTGAELGIPGLICLLAILGAWLKLSWQTVRYSRESNFAPVAAGGMGVVVVIFVHGFTETIMYSPKAYLIVWGACGVIVAVYLRFLYALTELGDAT